MYAWATSNGRLRWIFTLFLIATCLFYFRNEYLKDASGGRFLPFDGWFHYSSGDFKAEVEELSPRGRRMYVATQLSLDLIYPGIYLLLFGGWLAVLARPLRAAMPLMDHAALLPLVAVVADLIENLTVSFLIWQFDRFHTLQSFVPLAATATSAKWVSLLVLTLLLSVIFIINRVRKPG